MSKLTNNREIFYFQTAVLAEPSDFYMLFLVLLPYFIHTQDKKSTPTINNGLLLNTH